VKGARWVKYPLELLQQHMTPHPQSLAITLYGAATFTNSHKLLLIDNPKEMWGCTSAAWFNREVQVRRGFESTLVARIFKSVPDWGGFSLVVHNRGALGPAHGVYVHLFSSHIVCFFFSFVDSSVIFPALALL
jgi:hypothetical protein